MEGGGYFFKFFPILIFPRGAGPTTWDDFPSFTAD